MKQAGGYYSEKGKKCFLQDVTYGITIGCNNLK